MVGLVESSTGSLELWKQQNPEEAIDDAPFYMVGEVYNYYITNGREFDYGDRKVDFYKDGFHSLINFDFKTDAKLTYDTIFTKYSDQLHTALEGHSVLNYISSHDDGGPFDLHRDKAISAATKLLLTPGGVQIYYGDESARRLDIEAATGDAKLRSFMNWQELTDNVKRGDVLVQDVLLHYQRLGKFRHAHPAVGAGIHTTISMDPYICKREYTFEGGEDRVLIALEMPSGNKTIQ
jgi:alpha-amylase